MSMTRRHAWQSFLLKYCRVLWQLVTARFAIRKSPPMPPEIAVFRRLPHHCALCLFRWIFVVWVRSSSYSVTPQGGELSGELVSYAQPFCPIGSCRDIPGVRHRIGAGRSTWFIQTSGIWEYRPEGIVVEAGFCLRKGLGPPFTDAPREDLRPPGNPNSDCTFLR